MHEANALTKRIVKYVTTVTFLSVIFTATRKVKNNLLFASNVSKFVR